MWCRVRLPERPYRLQPLAVGYILAGLEGYASWRPPPCICQNESLLVPGKSYAGFGFGLIGDLLIGIIGAFIGDWLLPQIGIHLGTGIVSAIAKATIGAVLLLLVVRLLRGGDGWGGGWGRRRW